MTDEIPHIIDRILEDFISEMKWSCDRSEFDKALVLGNLRSFAGRVKSTLRREDELRRMLADACSKAGGLTAWAKKNDVSPQYVSDVIQGRRDPGISISSALRMERVVSYRPAQGAEP